MPPNVTVCLHCGELGADGALFCTKCGFTLPQADSPGTPPAPGVAPGTPPPPPGTAPPAPVAMATALRPPIAGTPWAVAPSGYAVLAPPVPGAVGPMPPPPVGKYCIRCRAVISRVAVYCPICQQPQS